MKILIINIKELVGINETNRPFVSGAAMGKLDTLKNAFLFIEKGLILEFGSMENLFIPDDWAKKGIKVIDATGKLVFPSFCDSHTHLLYSGSREKEYVDKIKGLSYEEIAKRGGGILNSAKRLHDASETELIGEALERLEEITWLGTGAVEIKSGYGLNTQDELKMLRVIRDLKRLSRLTIKSNFLGADEMRMEYRGK